MLNSDTLRCQRSEVVSSLTGDGELDDCSQRRCCAAGDERENGLVAGRPRQPAGSGNEPLQAAHPSCLLSASLRRHTQPLLRMPSKRERRILSCKAKGRDFLTKQLRGSL